MVVFLKGLSFRPSFHKGRERFRGSLYAIHCLGVLQSCLATTSSVSSSVWLCVIVCA